MAKKRRLSFPEDFLFGVATAAYQIEGARDEGGRGRSIWEAFESQPGRIERGESASLAADHYHRFGEDVRLMAELGVQAYRFSVAWPRVIPEGTGTVNTRGLDFYDRLVDELLSAGIVPVLTLYHWDLPLALQERGGWGNRDTASALAALAEAVAARLSDRVSWWITQNEPFITAIFGHLLGQHAPGLHDPAVAFRAVHHLLLSHGLAAAALRSICSQPPQIGITLNLSPVHAAADSEEDRLAAERFDGLLNRLFLEPLLGGSYPADTGAALGPLLADAVLPGDLEVIARPLDFLGVNYYTRVVVRDAPAVPFVGAAPVSPPGNEYSQMWEIYPAGLYELLMRLTASYGVRRIMVTENGICVADGVDHDGRIRDYRRMRYLRDHLEQIHRAIAEGAGVVGYLAWSLIDNFEWALGYRPRFGLVYVDFASQSRTVKESGRWYAQVIRERSLEPLAGSPYFPR